MRNEFVGRHCVYCAIRRARTADHVFARKFFTVENRGSLPQVPACEECNRAKRDLEQYLMTTAPFGGRHPDAALTLGMVEPRLKGNARLHRELASGTSSTLEKNGYGFWLMRITLLFDSTKLDKLFIYVVRGLFWHHFRLYLPKDTFIQAMSLTKAGEDAFGRVRLSAREDVKGDLGNGTVEYWGALGLRHREDSVWRFKLYGGIQLAGDSSVPNEESRSIGVMTGAVFEQAGFDKIVDL